MDYVPQNETPEIVKSVFNSVTEFLSVYGWTILFLLVVVNLLWSHVKPKLRKWKEKVDEQKQANAYRENPDLLIKRQESLARARQRLQEEHDRLAQEHAEKAKEQEEKKRQEKIVKWEQMQKGKSSLDSSASQPHPNSSNGNSLREGYNPLMNPGSGVCYRPSRRGGGSGGG